MDLATGRQLLRRQDGDNINNKNVKGSETSSTATTTVVGPYVEGSNVRVRCRVYGGQCLFEYISLDVVTLIPIKFKLDNAYFKNYYIYAFNKKFRVVKTVNQ